jgi:hypothetical protein
MTSTLASSPAIISTGSPADNSMEIKIIKDTPMMTGISISSRFRIYLYIGVPPEMAGRENPPRRRKDLDKIISES